MHSDLERRSIQSFESMFPVAIIAGGLATRLRPLTETIPKALVDFHGEPFVAHQLRLLSGMGIRHVVMCIGFLGSMIRAAVGTGETFGLVVEYSEDGPALLGTAGAVRRAIPLLGESFFVLYGDSYLPCDYAAVQRAFELNGKDGLMTVYRNEGRLDASNVEFQGGQIVIYDKKQRTATMNHIDYGLGVFHKRAFDTVGEGWADLAGVYQTLLRRGQLAAYEVPQRFYEIGSAQGIEELRQYLAQNQEAS
jgi:N-acetyl-alpha-D-muramate 1-phosphate uridylyltransferase